ncbi:MAG TPA: hypothetical protein VGQ59_06785, partial [Cyclobacteriaceae bacterium]|nr:hypothetical protein [Cyclobacteriaceae bacterium]
MNEQALYKLSKLQRKYLSYRYSEILLQSAGVSLLVYSILDWFLVESLFIKTFVCVLSGLSLFVVLLLYNRLHTLNKQSFTQYLNEKFPSLKESADLMLLDEGELPGLQQL